MYGSVAPLLDITLMSAPASLSAEIISAFPALAATHRAVVPLGRFQ